VVGGGVIGSEYACTFAALGAETHLIDSRDVLLPFLDGEVSRALAQAMAQGGVTFHWNDRAQACAITTSGEVELTLASGGALLVDAVLVAAGRKSNVEGLNLQAAGIVANERGLIRVDEHLRTSSPHIYAAGDVIGFPALASTSMQQARTAIRHAFGQPTAPRDSLALPAGIYTIPEIGMIGETEEALQRQGLEYVAGRALYRGSPRGRIIGDSAGFVKLLFRRPALRVVGVHVIGEQAAELVHIGMLALQMGATAESLADLCFNMPTLGELYKVASLDAISRVRTGRSLFDLQGEVNGGGSVESREVMQWKAAV
jgi:NAD(P) transhydrogenase